MSANDQNKSKKNIEDSIETIEESVAEVSDKEGHEVGGGGGKHLGLNKKRNEEEEKAND